MLYWILVFLVVALIAGVLGFTGLAVAAAGMVKLLFVIFLRCFSFHCLPISRVEESESRYRDIGIASEEGMQYCNSSLGTDCP
jgi:uncharacterized membrane protein YtjA (UPF0391 family)